MQIHIKLCGATTVINDQGERVDKLCGVKPRQVLEMLALSAGTPMSKDRIADLLWDGAPPPSYLGTLESYVCLLRRALGAGKGRNSALQTTTTGYVLRTDRVTVDIVQIREMLAEARTNPGQSRELVEKALDMAGAELLASEPYAPWAQEQRARLSHELVAGCTEAAIWSYEQGDTASTIRFARQAVQREALAEQAWQYLMRALADEFRHGEALKAYAELRQVMLDELGVEPSAASRTIYQDILDGMHSNEGASDHTELSVLMRLLRQALENLPGVELPAEDAALTQVAVRVLAAA
jgi:DNA-binding SARP family transcriptional activator